MNTKFFSRASFFAGSVSLLFAGAPVVAAETAGSATTDTPRYSLAYKFRAGDTLRWEVEQLKTVRTTVQGNTQTAEMTTRSVKVWKVIEILADGNFLLENSVESVDLRQKLTGREEVHWDSRSGAEPPLGFEAFARSVGVPIFAITMDSHGQVIERKQKLKAEVPAQGQLAIPLPTEAVPVGHVWNVPDDRTITLKSGQIVKVKTRQRFTLEAVNDHLAQIKVDTQILTPIEDPEVKVQMIDDAASGTIEFDIEEGRIVSQRIDHDDQVVGFAGETSSMHSVSRFTEKLLPSTALLTAAVPKRTEAATPPANDATRSASQSSSTPNKRRRL